MHFLSLDHRLFSLMMENSYVRLNDPDISDASMEVKISTLKTMITHTLANFGFREPQISHFRSLNRGVIRSGDGCLVSDSR